MEELIKVCETLGDPEAEYPMEVLMIYLICFWPYAHSQLDVFSREDWSCQNNKLELSLIAPCHGFQYRTKLAVIDVDFLQSFSWFFSKC